MEAALPYVIRVGLALTMLSMGLELTVRDFRKLVETPWAVVVGTFAKIVLLPVVAFLVVMAFGLKGPLAVGLVLVAACPGGPTAILLSSLARGDVALSIVLTAISDVVTVVSIPLVVNYAALTFMQSGSELHLPVVETMVTIVLITIVPVAIGMWLHAKRRALADRLDKPLRGISVGALVLFILGAVLKERAHLAEYVAQVGLPVLALNVGTMTLGLALAWVAKLGRARSITIALEVGMQNAAMAIGIALGLLNRPDVAIPAGIYAVFMYVTSGALVWWTRRTGPAAQPVPGIEL